MAKPHLFIFISFFIIGFYSCKKDDGPITVKVEGFVREKQTGRPIRNRLVYVYTAAGNGWATSYEILGEKRTDDDGYYEIPVTTDDVHISVGINDLGDYLGYFKYDFRATSSTFRQDFDLYVPGYLHVYLENKSQYYDSIIIGFSLPLFSNPPGLGYIGKAGGGFGNETFKTPAGENIKINFKVNKKGVITEYIDSIDIPYYDTAFYRGSF